MTATLERPHGYARYKIDRCRCYTCAWAKASYCEARNAAIAAGTWQPYVDIGPTRAHILELKQAGFGEITIGRLAGIHHSNIGTIIRGRSNRSTPPKRVRPKTAAAILSVDITPDTLPDATIVDSTGTIRRLQALCAAGWPRRELQRRLNVDMGSYARGARVTARTARAVQALYDELWRKDPREHGVRNQVYVLCRNKASTKGWAPIGAWDDDTIDDPTAVPDWTGHCGTTKGYRAHYTQGLTPPCRACVTAKVAANRARQQAA